MNFVQLYILCLVVVLLKAETVSYREAIDLDQCLELKNDLQNRTQSVRVQLRTCRHEIVKRKYNIENIIRMEQHLELLLDTCKQEILQFRGDRNFTKNELMTDQRGVCHEDTHLYQQRLEWDHQDLENCRLDAGLLSTVERWLHSAQQNPASSYESCVLQREYWRDVKHNMTSLGRDIRSSNTDIEINCEK